MTTTTEALRRLFTSYGNAMYRNDPDAAEGLAQKFDAALAALPAGEPAAAPAHAVPADARATFEAWMRKDNTLPLDADAHGYADFNVALMWHVWQAATKANAPVGALGGGSDANARPGLAGDDSACAHEFALQPSSSILLCCRCGLSETAVRAAQRHAPTPQAAPTPLPLTDERIAYFARHAADRIPASNYEGRVLHAVRMAEATHGITATPAKE